LMDLFTVTTADGTKAPPVNPTASTTRRRPDKWNLVSRPNSGNPTFGRHVLTITVTNLAVPQAVTIGGARPRTRGNHRGFFFFPSDLDHRDTRPARAGTAALWVRPGRHQRGGTHCSAYVSHVPGRSRRCTLERSTPVAPSVIINPARNFTGATAVKIRGGAAAASSPPRPRVDLATVARRHVRHSSTSSLTRRPRSQARPRQAPDHSTYVGSDRRQTWSNLTDFDGGR